MSDELRHDCRVMPIICNRSYEDLIIWPSLHQLEMGPAKVEARREGIGGSDANIILSGDKEAIRKLCASNAGRSARVIFPTSCR